RSWAPGVSGPWGSPTTSSRSEATRWPPSVSWRASAACSAGSSRSPSSSGGPRSRRSPSSCGAAREDRPVFALESRGFSEGQAPLHSIEEMADLYLAAIREVRPRGPYRLLGYSMGSKIAFAMARELERDGETVEQLVLVDIPVLPRTET